MARSEVAAAETQVHGVRAELLDQQAEHLVERDRLQVQREELADELDAVRTELAEERSRTWVLVETLRGE